MVGWKALGFVLAKTGGISDALIANEKAVALSPQDAETIIFWASHKEGLVN